LETQVNLQGEMWRYQTIVREPRIARPVGWFLPREFVIFQTTKGKWRLGQNIEVSGNPPCLMICMNLHKGSCQAECESHCRHRYWALGDQAGVMGKGDLLRIIADPSLLAVPDSPYLVRDYSQVRHFLRLISNAEKRQKSC
jgi:hypothetical protein